MAEKSWTDEYQTMIDDCEKRESQLDDWERGSVDSVSRQLERGCSLSTKRIEKLESIWDRVTSARHYRG